MNQTCGTRLVEFAFTSQLAADVAEEAVARMVRQTWRDSVDSGVTGVLKLRGRRLEQVVEGPSDVVLALAARILTDRRHGWIKIGSFGAVAARRFTSWRIEGFEPAPADPGDARAANVRVVRFGAMSTLGATAAGTAVAVLP